MRKNLFVSMFVLLVAVLVLSACGPAATPTAEVPVNTPVPPTETAVPTVDPLAMYMPDAVTGDIITAGSSTVFPLSERMKQRFEEEGFTGRITIDSIGSGAGFERFCKNGETDISNASRAIKSSEVESCQAIGREPLEFRVGTDALAVVVSKDNTFLTDVTLAELAQIFSTAQKWSDVRPEWPAEPILRFIPGTDSGTFDYFVENVMAPANLNADGKADLALGETAILAAANLQMSEDDNVLVQGVEGSPYAIGFFGFAYYHENASRLNVLSVEGVAPNEQTAEDNTYPISRPLFIYSTAQIMQDKPQVAAFIYFYLTRVNDEILDVGYFPASQTVLDEALNTWHTAVGN
ncbi:MAG: PstS family phosphate ABC transporter substrate-binding protein [Anaerolineales bacterium]|nr:PstS family phosphate ABC transporter substrate-binding protein [Anaerolineales bacterium]